MSTSLPIAEPEILKGSRARTQCLWYTVIHDDSVNMMSYVTWVFHSYFGFPLSVAEAWMVQVRTTGRAVVSQRVHECMEVDVTAMHGYGLYAATGPVGDDASADDSSGGR